MDVQRLDPQSALINLMVLVSAADSDMTDDELRGIGDVVKTLPVFRGFDLDRLVPVAQDCARRLNDEDGLEQLLSDIARVLPKRLHETGYALACEIAAADRFVEQEELRILEIIRGALSLDRLVGAAIERGARARHIRL